MYACIYIYIIYVYIRRIFVYIYIYIFVYISTHLFTYCVYCKNASSHIHMSGSTRTAVGAISVAWAAQGASSGGRGWPEPFASDFRACEGKDRGRSNLDILHCGAAAKCQGH